MNFNFEQLTAKHLNLLRDRIRDTLAAKNLDNTGEAGMSLEVQGSKLLGADYLYYLDKGRGPGKFPPVQNIRDWVRQKLGVDDKEAKGIAFLVGRKISKEGTEIYKNSSKGIELDSLVSEMLDELTKELPQEMAAEALKWV
jgi:hypothetical protein